MKKEVMDMKMVHIQGGTFNMGDEHGDIGGGCRPVHQVSVSDFYIGTYPVTQALWLAVMGGKNPSFFEGGNLPVEQVSWNDAQAFVQALNQITKGVRLEGYHYRLPTEAEWEYAARGGTFSKGFRYAGSNDLYEVGWYWENSDAETHPVGQLSPNELGIYDMGGNVWEWCSDWYGKYSSDSQTNPTGAKHGGYRVNRGGSWSFGAPGCRASHRTGDAPDSLGDDLGFRLVLSL